MRKFLQEGAYQTTEPWTSIVGPGGEWWAISSHHFWELHLNNHVHREYVLNHFSFSMMRFHNFLQQWPQWMLYMVTGGIGTLILSVLHSPSKPAAKPKVKSDAATSTAAPAVNAGPEVKAGGSHKKKHHNKKWLCWVCAVFRVFICNARVIRYGREPMLSPRILNESSLNHACLFPRIPKFRLIFTSPKLLPKAYRINFRIAVKQEKHTSSCQRHVHRRLQHSASLWIHE